MPNNCNECEHTKTCKSHYGGLGCKHSDEIAEKGKRNEEKD